MNRLTALCFSACLAWSSYAASFSDDFTRGTDPGPLDSWTVQVGNWTVTGGEMRAGTNAANTYGYAYITNEWANYSVEARVRLPVGAYGGGIGGRLNPATGAHYAAWLYPEGSSGGSNVLKLVKFKTWTSFSYNGANSAPMAQVNVAAIGTNWHTLQLAFEGNQIRVSLDSVVLITTTDVEATPYNSGSVSLDMWTGTPYAMWFDDVLVSPISSVPVASNDSYSMAAGSTLAVAAPGVLANDSGGNGPLTAVLESGASEGLLTLNADGSFSYTPTNDFVGTDTFTYRATDGETNSEIATVTLNVNANQPPVANADSYSVLGNTSLSVAAPGVLGNDTDPEDDPLTAVLDSGAANGSVSLNSDGSFVYTPNTNFTGTDSFTYHAHDGLSNSVAATVHIAVYTGGTWFYDGFARTTLSPWINRAGNWALTNDLLQSGSNAPLSYSTVYITNRWTNFAAQARFRFAPGAFGGGIAGRVATQTGARYGAWIYPSAGANNLRLVKFVNWTNFVFGGVTNRVVAQTTVPAVGTNWHTLKLAFNGSDIAIYYDGAQALSVTDNETNALASGSISLDTWTDATSRTMFVDDVMVDPLVRNDQYALAEEDSLIVNDPGVLANDTPVFNSFLLASLVQAPSHGVLTLSSNGGFSYVPNTNYSGTDSFTYRAIDNSLAMGTGTVSLVVSNINDPPQFAGTPTNRTVVEGTPLTISNPASDPDNPTLVYQLVSPPEGATINSSGVISWTPSEAQGGATYSITTWVTDNGSPAFHITNSFEITVLDENSAPVLPAIADLTVAPLTELYFTNTATDADIPVDTLAYTLAEAPVGATISDSGVIHWIPAIEQDNTTNLFRTIVSDNGNPALSATNSFVVMVSTRPVIVLESSSLLAEGCLPANGIVDTGEEVTFQFTFRNVGYGSTTNLIITLQETNGVVAPPAPQSMGAVPIEGVAGVPFSFAVTGACGGTFSAVFAVRDDTFDLGTLSAEFPIGAVGTILTQNFDSVTAPALPEGWSTSSSGGMANWFTTNSPSDNPPNSACSRNSSAVGENELVSPVFYAGDSGAQVQFRHRYSMESGSTVAYDAGVLEIKIGDGNFQDIIAAGGSFVTGGYNRIVATTYNSPLAGRQAWSGTRTSFGDVVANLPPSAAGQMIQLRWRCASDAGGPVGTGWFVDSIGVSGTICCANSAPVLASVTNRVVSEFEPLVVDNGAVDAGQPASALVYELLEAPAGAEVGSTGLITWTPLESDGGGTFTFTMAARNGAIPELAATNSFQVFVDEVNSHPLLTVPADQIVDEFSTLAVSAGATDSDEPANGLTFALASAPAGMTIDPVTGAIEWTPQEADGPGTNEIVVVVTDDGIPALSTTNVFSVAVNEINNAPLLTLPADQVLDEMSLLAVSAAATDPDYTPNLLTFSLDAAPAGMTIDPLTGAIDWTPGESDGPGTNVVVVVVTDDASPALSTTNSFLIVVNEVNSAPALTVPSEQSIDEYSLLAVSASAVDLDEPANNLTFSLDAAPAGMTIDPLTGAISWTPVEADGPGTNQVAVVVSDDGAPPLSTTNVFTVVVKEIDNAPFLTVPADQVIDELTALAVSASATDEDSPTNTLTFSLESAPAGMTIDPATGAIDWTPSETDGPATNEVTVVVTSEGDTVLSATNAFTVVVNEVNTAPTLEAIPEQVLDELATLALSPAATDPDDPTNTLTFSFAAAPAAMTIDPATGAISWIPTEADGPGTNEVLVVVTDDGTPALSTTNAFSVVVNELNTAPLLTVPDTQTLDELTSLVVSANATDADEPANTLAFSLATAPAGMTIDPLTGAISWTPTEADGPGTNEVAVVVTDNGAPALSTTNLFTVVVDEVNTAPSLTVPADQAIDELGTLVVSATATDADEPANTLTFSLATAPLGMTIDPVTGAITWATTETDGPGTNEVMVVVTDDGTPALSATNVFTVIVNDIDNPPLLALPEDQVLDELATLAVSAMASDADSPTNVLTFSLAVAPIGMTIDPVAGSISWTPSEADGPGTNQVAVVVTSEGTVLLSSTNVFTVVVNEVNSAPVLDTPPLQTVAELAVLDISTSAMDSDEPANTLTFSLDAAPAGMTIDPLTGAISWTPTEADGPGTNEVVVVVTDDGSPALSTTNSFTVIVNEVNSAPVVTVPDEQTLDELATLAVSATATDSDDPTNTLTFSLDAAPAGMTIDPLTGAISWTPTEPDGPGTNEVAVVVTDDGSPALSTTNSFTVIVNEVNSAPVVTVPDEQTLDELATLAVSASATDNDDPTNTLTFSLDAAPAGMTIDPLTGAISWTPTEADGPGTNVVAVVVTDDGLPALSTTNSFTVIINEVNSAPVVTVPDEQTLDELATLAVSATATDSDDPTNTLTFSLDAAPAGMTIDPLTGAISWTPTEADGPGTNVVAVVVTDDGSPALSATNSFTVIINEVNSAPVLAAQADQVIAPTTLLVVTNAAVDDDLPANTLTYTLLEAPAGAEIDTNGVITWDPASAPNGSTNLFTTVVTDSGTNPGPLSATNSFNVVVITEEPPRILSLVVDGGTTTVTWTSIPGRSYTLQSIESLAQTEWVDAATGLVASEDTLSATNDTTGIPSRFFRVLMEP